MNKFRLSIIFTVYNSHEVVRRQIEYFKKMNLPDDVEIIIMDDESSPPLEFHNHGLKNFNIYRTGNKAPWTQALARNQSIEKAKSDNLLFTDIDHFFPRDTIMACLDFDGDKMMFKRQYGVLDENGEFTQDMNVLRQYGLKKGRIRKNKHNNSFFIRKEVYKRLGGYKRKYWENRFHRSGDSSFFTRYERAVARGKFKPALIDNLIYVFPDTNWNSIKLFHGLSRQNFSIKEDKK